MWLVTMCNRQPVYDGLRVSEVVVGMRNDSFMVYIFLSVYLPPV